MSSLLVLPFLNDEDLNDEDLQSIYTEAHAGFQESCGPGTGACPNLLVGIRCRYTDHAQAAPIYIFIFAGDAAQPSECVVAQAQNAPMECEEAHFLLTLYDVYALKLSAVDKSTTSEFRAFNTPEPLVGLL